MEKSALEKKDTVLFLVAVFLKWEKLEIMGFIICWSFQCFLYEIDITVEWKKNILDSCDRRKIWVVHNFWFRFNFWEGHCFLDPSVLGILTNFSLPHPYICVHSRLLLLYFYYFLICLFSACVWWSKVFILFVYNVFHLGGWVGGGACARADREENREKKKKCRKVERANP